MICSSLNRDRFIVRLFLGPCSSLPWRNFRGSRQAGSDAKRISASAYRCLDCACPQHELKADLRSDVSLHPVPSIGSSITIPNLMFTQLAYSPDSSDIDLVSVSGRGRWTSAKA